MPKALVIVESPTKAKTITRFLGKEFLVEPSFGHIRDLPKSRMGVDVEKNFEPAYEVKKEDKERVMHLKKLAKSAAEVYFATDEDREGEAISWHLSELLKIPSSKIKRIVFHEITKEAILKALETPRALDMKRVDAQQARRILDRLVGYELSPFLWRKVARGLSAGRVQSVAVRLIVEREREIQAFKPEEYWTVEALFKHHNDAFPAKLLKLDYKSLDKFTVNTKKQAEKIVADLKKADFKIGEIINKTTNRYPNPPFTTSTLQQDANRRLGFSARQTMRLAQQLYEGVKLGEAGQTGLITYMRTDSLNLADKFVNEANDFLKKTFGSDYAIGGRRYKTHAKGAQEAHEAIRPTDVNLNPEKIQAYLLPDQYQLYDLIWKRALASQMPEAIINQTSVDIVANRLGAVFRANGATVRFTGFLKVYPDGAKETFLPVLKSNDAVALQKIDGVQHFTEPPARFSDASLVKTLEEYGIGRPSTYAPTIGTIIDRGYVIREDRRLKPTEVAYLVNDLLVKHFPEIVDFKFTAKMEEEFDVIAEGKIAWQPVIKEFYEPFKKHLIQKDAEISKKDITEKATDHICEKCGRPMVEKFGRFGKFLACTGYPECKNTINLDANGNHATRAEAKILGNHPETGEPIFLKTGRFGTYIQVGEKAKGKTLRSASLLSGMTAETLTLEQALELLTLPKLLGQTDTGEDIISANGRFGPYIKAGKETRSIPADKSPLTITLTEAKELLSQPKSFAARNSKKTLFDLGKDPVSGKDIKIMEGRYGMYITDGATNASLPKGLAVETVSLSQALEILAEKEKSPKKTRRRKKKP
ncbi:type I DNA topoisomerase [Candidatus Parcubacteria bacterium]|jgi:DNA topoisomerase-1|nr:MAG: type I DNA topoisomerase [Candidatus Parcubacteria bacterium]